MISFTPRSHIAVFDFNKIAYMNIFSKDCAWAQSGIRSDHTASANGCLVNMTEALNLNVGINHGIFDQAMRTNRNTWTKDHLSFKDTTDVNLDIGATLKFTTNIYARWIQQGNAWLQ